MSTEPRKQLRVDRLELNRETVTELTDEEAEEVQGGRAFARESAECATGNCVTREACGRMTRTS